MSGKGVGGRVKCGQVVYMWRGGWEVRGGRTARHHPPLVMFFFYFLFVVRGAVSLGSTRDRDERGGRRKFDFNSLPLAY